MATFKALNIESDDEEDIEVDNTKEIQIEDALKLYQDALKLHSEGPQAHEQAAAAYDALFRSEIFAYPEAQSELKRLDLFGPPPEQDEPLPEDEGVVFTGYAGTDENALGTLPQLIHLSHKNYGQFVLESLQHKISNAADVTLEDITKASIAALNSFVEALDKDDTDPDLWRRTAAVGHLLGSHRIARYCLEAVLDGDETGIESVLALPGLAESLAGQQLRQLAINLQDQLSLLQSPLSHTKKRKLSKLLKQRLSTYQAVQAYQSSLPSKSSAPHPLRSVLAPPRAWCDFADLVLCHALSEIHGTGTNMPGLGVSFKLTGPPTNANAMQVDNPISSTEPSPKLLELSSLAVHQFKGMDGGMPTAPCPAFPIDDLVDWSDAASRAAAGQLSTLPTRKRSGDAAGLQESVEAGRGRSKRVRARESNVADQSQLDDDPIVDTTQAQYALADLDFVDGLMISTVNKTLQDLALPCFDISVADRGNLRATSRKAVQEAPLSPSKRDLQAPDMDLYDFFEAYSDSRAKAVLLASVDLDSTTDASIQPSTITSTGQPKQSWPEIQQDEGVEEFMKHVNTQWLHINEVIYLWLSEFMKPRSTILRPPLPESKSSYSGHKWQKPLKTIIVRIVVKLDDYIYHCLSEKFEEHDARLLRQKDHATHLPTVHEALRDVEMVQALFEIHLDVYSLIKEPNSGVDVDTVVTQGDRTDRWANLARDAMNLRSSMLELPSLKDELNLRYLWAATHHISVLGGISREHVIGCWQELRSIFVAVGRPVIELQNNAIMPYMSVESIDRELSRLTTQDFFVKVFDTENTDLTVVIESLEPLLELLHADSHGQDGNRRRRESDTDSSTLDGQSNREPSVDGALDLSSGLSPELLNFLRNSHTSLRISLWQRLREAYEKIEYYPMVVCCYFRMMEILVSNLRDSSYTNKPIMERQTMLLKYLRLSHDLMFQILDITNKHDNALECMDMDRIHTGLGAILNLMNILHSYTLFHDDVRVGLRQVPTASNGLAYPSFRLLTEVLQEMQLRTWILTYKIIGEAIAQNRDKFESPDTNLFDILRSIHNVVGARGLCGKFNQMFLKMLKQEYLRMRTDQSVSSEYFDIEFAQVLYDLYGLKLFLNPAIEQQEHQCHPEASADKHSAMQAVDLLLALSKKMKMTELLKHPIKDTIEKVHTAVGRKKPSEAIIKNRELLRAFLKAPINPKDLFESVYGEGTLTLLPVQTEHAILSARGWYFLMGEMHLTRFRSQQKRTGPAATDDLDIAIALFNQELEYSVDNWETWFRIAQAYDSKIEEHVSWSAEKLSSNAAEIIQLQKSAIHCYRMAVATAMRSATPGPETQAKLGKLFADFAMRIYASTTEPFNMQAFALEDVEKFFSTDTLCKGIPFRPMKRYVAWKFARGLFNRAILRSPDNWT